MKLGRMKKSRFTRRWDVGTAVQGRYPLKRVNYEQKGIPNRLTTAPVEEGLLARIKIGDQVFAYRKGISRHWFSRRASEAGKQRRAPITDERRVCDDPKHNRNPSTSRRPGPQTRDSNRPTRSHTSQSRIARQRLTKRCALTNRNCSPCSGCPLSWCSPKSWRRRSSFARTRTPKPR